MSCAPKEDSDLSFRWAHRLFCWFCRAATHMRKNYVAENFESNLCAEKKKNIIWIFGLMGPSNHGFSISLTHPVHYRALSRSLSLNL